MEGELYNPIYELSEDGQAFNTFRWNSHILNGSGGFEKLGMDKLKLKSNRIYLKGQSCVMKACELHTVFVEMGKLCVWLIEESIPSCEYFPINYSPHDLTQWKSDGLYIKVGDEVKNQYIQKYFNQ